MVGYFNIVADVTGLVIVVGIGIMILQNWPAFRVLQSLFTTWDVQAFHPIVFFTLPVWAIFAANLLVHMVVTMMNVPLLTDSCIDEVDRMFAKAEQAEEEEEEILSAGLDYERAISPIPGKVESYEGDIWGEEVEKEQLEMPQLPKEKIKEDFDENFMYMEGDWYEQVEKEDPLVHGGEEVLPPMEPGEQKPLQEPEGEVVEFVSERRKKDQVQVVIQEQAPEEVPEVVKKATEATPKKSPKEARMESPMRKEAPQPETKETREAGVSNAPEETQKEVPKKTEMKAPEVAEKKTPKEFRKKLPEPVEEEAEVKKETVTEKRVPPVKEFDQIQARPLPMVTQAPFMEKDESPSVQRRSSPAPPPTKEELQLTAAGDLKSFVAGEIPSDYVSEEETLEAFEKPLRPSLAPEERTLIQAEDVEIPGAEIKAEMMSKIYEPQFTGPPDWEKLPLAGDLRMVGGKWTIMS